MRLQQASQELYLLCFILSSEYEVRSQQGRHVRDRRLSISCDLVTVMTLVEKAGRETALQCSEESSQQVLKSGERCLLSARGGLSPFLFCVVEAHPFPRLGRNYSLVLLCLEAQPWACGRFLLVLMGRWMGGVGVSVPTKRSRMKERFTH